MKARSQPDTENIPPWTRELANYRPPYCDAHPAVLLVTRLPLTELGYLQQYIDQSLIDKFVTNTNLYATARRATHWVPVTAEEMWRFLAVRIRQGIVDLPELHMYWEHGYADSYITQLMPRNRFMQLHSLLAHRTTGPARSTPDRCPEGRRLLPPVSASVRCVLFTWPGLGSGRDDDSGLKAVLSG